MGVGGIGVTQHELGLQTDPGGDPPVGEPGDLALQDLPRGHTDRLSVVAHGIGEDQSGAPHPGQLVGGVYVGAHTHVTPAGVGGGQGEAVERAHVRVGGQDVGAHVTAAERDAVNEVLRVDPLALQPTQHVGHGHHHGLHSPAVHQAAQGRETGDLRLERGVVHTRSSPSSARSLAVPYAGMP